MHLQTKIESLQREFDFVSKLSTEEVTFILQKKKDHAARMIQRVARRFLGKQRRKELRAQLKSNAGMTSDDQALLKAYVPDDVLEKRKQELKRLKERVDEKLGTNVMRFYDKPMGEERKTELKDIVALKRRLFP